MSWFSRKEVSNSRMTGPVEMSPDSLWSLEKKRPEEVEKMKEFWSPGLKSISTVSGSKYLENLEPRFVMPEGKSFILPPMLRVRSAFEPAGSPSLSSITSQEETLPCSSRATILVLTFLTSAMSLLIGQ